jgi:uncharacterized protein (TIGR03382 family)
MVAYYGSLAHEGGRTESLRDAQLAMLASDARAHPYFWASFIPLGDWRSMDGAEVPVHVTRAPRASSDERVKPGACGCDTAGRASASPLALLACFALGALLRRRHRAARRKSKRVASSDGTTTSIVMP